MGLTLVDRDLSSMTTEGPGGERDHYSILQLFPFTSERKRMGIIVRVRPRDSVSYICSCVVLLSIDLFVRKHDRHPDHCQNGSLWFNYFVWSVFVTHMFACCM